MRKIVARKLARLSSYGLIGRKNIRGSVGEKLVPFLIVEILLPKNSVKYLIKDAIF